MIVMLINSDIFCRNISWWFAIGSRFWHRRVLSWCSHNRCHQMTSNGPYNHFNTFVDKSAIKNLKLCDMNHKTRVKWLTFPSVITRSCHLLWTLGLKFRSLLLLVVVPVRLCKKLKENKEEMRQSIEYFRRNKRLVCKTSIYQQENLENCNKSNTMWDNIIIL